MLCERNLRVGVNRLDKFAQHIPLLLSGSSRWERLLKRDLGNNADRHDAILGAGKRLFKAGEAGFNIHSATSRGTVDESTTPSPAHVS